MRTFHNFNEPERVGLTWLYRGVECSVRRTTQGWLSGRVKLKEGQRVPLPISNEFVSQMHGEHHCILLGKSTKYCTLMEVTAFTEQLADHVEEDQAWL